MISDLPFWAIHGVVLAKSRRTSHCNARSTSFANMSGSKQLIFCNFVQDILLADVSSSVTELRTVIWLERTPRTLSLTRLPCSKLCTRRTHSEASTCKLSWLTRRERENFAYRFRYIHLWGSFERSRFQTLNVQVSAALTKVRNRREKRYWKGLLFLVLGTR